MIPTQPLAIAIISIPIIGCSSNYLIFNYARTVWLYLIHYHIFFIIYTMHMHIAHGHGC